MSTTFTDLGASADIADRLASAGIDIPTAIQAATIPTALEGRDLCGRAPTGSGKTLAFSIPLVTLVRRAKPGAPRALVLTPTRELAGQVEDTIRSLADERTARVASFYGGTSVNKDIRRLQRGVDIAVATPGRLADLVRQGKFDLSSVELVVLDEADRMADMGFLPEVKRLLDRTSPDRQTLLFSATLDGDVDVLVKRYQNDPATYEVDTPTEAAGDVSHHFWGVDGHARRELTGELVRGTWPAIVFTRTKRGADRLARTLKRDGVDAAAIHGDRSQRQRERALSDFGAGKVSVLVATDVAARGIHVDDVALVLHYDLAGSDKDYVHRSGRTGRAGATGTVVSFVLPDKRGDAKDIQRSLDLPTGLTRADVGALDAPTPRRSTPARRTARAVQTDPATPKAESPARETAPATHTPKAESPVRETAPTESGRRRRGRGRDRVGSDGIANGTVKWFHGNRGFGFIIPDDGGKDLFVHYSGIAGNGYRSLEEGQRVRFDVVKGRKGPQAAEVTPVAA